LEPRDEKIEKEMKPEPKKPRKAAVKKDSAAKDAAAKDAAAKKAANAEEAEMKKQVATAKKAARILERDVQKSNDAIAKLETKAKELRDKLALKMATRLEVEQQCV
jgi:hypothetical protein